MQARLLGLLGVSAVILAWAVLLVEELVQDARQKLGCNRRSRAAVGNVWNGLHIWYCTHSRSLFCALCLRACPLVAFACCVVRAQSSCRPFPCLFPQANLWQKSSAAGFISRNQCVNSQNPEPSTRTAKRKTGFQFQFIITSCLSTAVGQGAELREHRSQAQPHLLPDQTRTEQEGREERPFSFLLSFPLVLAPQTRQLRPTD